MEFTKEQVRAVRGAKLYSWLYWVHVEVLIDGTWITPYLVEEEKLNWFDTSTKLNPTKENMKTFLLSALKEINSRLARGYKLVDFEKYKEIIHRYHYPDEYAPEIVYL